MKTINFFYYMSAIFWYTHIISIEYVYPVGLYNQFLYSVKQTNQHKLQLYKQSIHTGMIKREVYSFNQEMLHGHMITHFTFLPHDAGYSFIDNGRLRIKYHDKPSPTSVDFLYPIYDLHSALWIDKNKGIVCAKYKNCFGLYYFAIDGRVEPILWTGNADFLYPQIIGDQIFCIKRSLNNKTSEIVSFKMPTAKTCLVAWESLHLDDQIDILMRKSSDNVEETQSIIHTIPIKNGAHLHMINAHEGFYVELPSSKTLNQALLIFKYHQITKVDGEWQSHKLFDFNAPKVFFENESEMYLLEKVRPLLPIIANDNLYFAHADSFYTMGIFSYGLLDGIIKKIHIKEKVYYFGLLYQDNKLYFGGEVKDKEQNN